MSEGIRANNTAILLAQVLNVGHIHWIWQAAWFNTSQRGNNVNV